MGLRAPQHIPQHRLPAASDNPRLSRRLVQDRRTVRDRRAVRDRPGLVAGLLGGACVLGLFILLALLYNAG